MKQHFPLHTKDSTKTQQNNSTVISFKGSVLTRIYIITVSAKFLNEFYGHSWPRKQEGTESKNYKTVKKKFKRIKLRYLICQEVNNLGARNIFYSFLHCSYIQGWNDRRSCLLNKGKEVILKVSKKKI